MKEKYICLIFNLTQLHAWCQWRPSALQWHKPGQTTKLPSSCMWCEQRRTKGDWWRRCESDAVLMISIQGNQSRTGYMQRKKMFDYSSWWNTSGRPWNALLLLLVPISSFDCNHLVGDVRKMLGDMQHHLDFDPMEFCVRFAVWWDSLKQIRNPMLTPIDCIVKDCSCFIVIDWG